MSTDSNRMAHNCNNTTSNNTFVSQSHEQFIPKRMKKANLFVKSLGVLALLFCSLQQVSAQFTCPQVYYRNNGNGGASSCPGVGATAIAPTVVGTQYATVPTTTKTGNLTMKFTTSQTVIPVITNVWINGAASSCQFGPPSAEYVVGGNYHIDYCFYNTNLPNAGSNIWTVRFVNPSNGQILGECSYDPSDVTATTPTLDPPLTPPTISAIPDYSSCLNGYNTGAISFTIGDAETATTSLTVTATSSNTTLVPNGNITLGGSGANRTITVATVAGQTGTTTITVLVSDGDAMQATETFTVTRTTSNLAATLTAGTRPCSPSANGSMTANITGGTAPFTYAWTRSNTSTGTYTSYAANNNTNPTNLSSGWYKLTVTDACGSITTTAVQLAAATSVTINSSSSALTSCNAGTVTLLVQGGIGTTKTATLTDVLNSSNVYTATPSSVSAGVYTITLSNVPVGTYSVSVAEQGSACTTAGSNISLTPVSISGVATSQVISCYGGSNGALTVTAANGTAPYTYAWYAGPNASGTVLGTNASITGLAAGDYTVLVTDALSCTANSTYQLTEPDEIVPDGVPSNSLCSNTTDGAISSVNSLTTGGTGAYTYAWTASNGGTVPSGQSTNANLTGLGAGDYTVVVTDANGCTGTNTFTISAPAAVSFAGATVSNVTCYGAGNGSITANLSGGNTPYSSYSWSNGTAVVGTSANISNLVPGSYTLTVVDGNLCTFTSNAFTITQPNLIAGTLSTTTTAPVCQNASSPTLTFTGSGSAGVNPYTFTYTIDGGSPLTLTTSGSNLTYDLSIPTSSAGTFVYALTQITDNTGCSVSVSGQSQSFTVLATPTVTDPSDIVACGLQTVAAVTLSGSNATTYTWSNSNTAIGLAASGTANSANQYKIPSFTASNAQLQQTATITVTPNNISGGTSCAGSPETYAITINQTPVLANGTSTICSGQTFTYTPGGSDVVPNGTTYTWTVNNANVTGESNVGGSQFITNSNYLNQNSITWSSQNTTWLQEYVAPYSGTLNSLEIPMYSWTTAGVTDDIYVEIQDEYGNPIGTTTTPITVTSPGGFGANLGSATFSFSGVNLQAGHVFKFRIYTTNGNTTSVYMKYGNSGQYPNPVWINNSATYDQQIFFMGNMSASGNASVSQTLTNTTNTAQNVVYTVTPNANGCDGSPFTVTVTVNPIPSIQTELASSCSDVPFTSTPMNGGSNIVPSGTTYTWTVVNNANTTGESDQATAQANISQTINNVSSADEIVTYTVTPSFGQCVGSTFTLDVTVNPEPVVQNEGTTICTGNQVTFVPSNGNGNYVPNGTTYDWTFTDNTNVSGEANPSPSLQVQEFNTNNPGWYAMVGQQFDMFNQTWGQTQNVGQTFTSAGGQLAQIVVNFQSVSNPGNFTFNLYDGIGVNGTVLNTQTINVTSSGQYTITLPYIALTAGQQYTFVINGTQVTANITISSNVYNGGGSYTANSNGTTYVNNVNNDLYFVNNYASAVSQFDNTLVNATSSSEDVIYSITPTSALGCSGEAFDFTVTIDPAPSILDQTTSVCSGSNFTLTPSDGNGNVVPNGTTYSWSAPSVSGISGTASGNNSSSIVGSLTNATNAPIDVTYTITPANGSAPVAVGDSYNGGIVAYIFQPSDYGYTPGKILIVYPSYVNAGICNAPGYQFTMQNPTAVTNTGIGYGAENTANLVAAGHTSISAEIGYVDQSTLGGQSDWFVPSSEELVQILTNLPSSYFAFNSFLIRSSSENPANLGQTYAHYRSGASVASTFQNDGGCSNGIMARYDVVNPGCVGPNFDLTVTVNPTPVISNKTATICDDGTFTVSPTNGGADIVPANTTYTYVVTSNSGVTGAADESNASASISQTLSNNTDVDQTVVYTVTPTSGAGGNCVGANFTVTVTVQPAPIVANQTATICSSAQVGLTLGDDDNTPAAATWDISNISLTSGISAYGGNATTGTINSNSAIQADAFANSNAASDDVVYTITPISAAGCSGTPFTVTATIIPIPTVDQQNNITYCGGVSQPDITFTGSTLNTQYNWTATENVGFFSSGIASPSIGSYVISPSSQVISTVVVTPEIVTGGLTCVGSAMTFTVTVNPTPNVNAVNDQVICNGSSTADINFSGTVPTGLSLLAYEGFDYPNNTNIANQSGGIGWAGNWEANYYGNSSMYVYSPGLTYTGLNDTGNKLQWAGPGQYQPHSVRRSFDNPNSGIVYFQFLSDFNSTSGGTDRVDLNLNGTTMAYIGGNNAQGEMSLSAGGQMMNSGYSVFDPSLVVVQIDYDNHTTKMWVNPTLASFDYNNPGTPAIVYNNSIPFDQISLTFRSGATIDELTVYGGTSYNWSNDNTATGLAASGIGNILSFTGTNNTNAPIVSNITVTPTLNGCTGTSINTSITVYPTPTVDTIANQTVCVGSPVSQSFASTFNATGTEYMWSNTNTAIGLGANGFGDIASFTTTNATNTPISGTVTVTPYVVNGTGISYGFINNGSSSTFNAPAGAIFTGVQFASYGDPSGGQGNYAVGSCSSANSQSIIEALALGNNSFSVTADDATFGATCSGGNLAITLEYSYICEGTPETFDITVNPIPTVDATSDILVCNGSPVSATFTSSFGVSGTVYTWSNDLTTIGLGATNTGDIASFNGTNTGTSAVTANVTVTPSYTNNSVVCTGTADAFTITVNPTPTVNTVPNQIICTGDNTTAVNFTGAVAGTTFPWTNDNTVIGLSSPNTGNISSFVGLNGTDVPVIGNITVTPTTTGGITCTGTPRTFSITVNPTPEIEDVNEDVCNNYLFTYQPSTGGGDSGNDIVGANTTYTWSAPSAITGVSGLSAGTNETDFHAQVVNTTNAVVTVTYTVTPTTTNANGSPCVGQPFDVTLNVGPTFTIATQTAQICSGEQFLVTPVNGVNGNVIPSGVYYEWNAPSSVNVTGMAASGNNGESNISGTLINVTAVSQVITYSVTPYFDNNGVTCSGAPFNVAVTVLTGAPSVSVGSDLTTCSNDTAEVSVTTVNAIFGSWSSSGSGVFTPGVTSTTIGYLPSAADLTSGSVSLTYTATNGCGSNSDDLVVTVIPAPTVDAGLDATICFGGTATLTAATTGLTSYSWSNGATTASITVSPTATTTYTFTGQAVNGCSNTDEAQFIVNPLPLATISTIGSTTVCDGGSMTLLAPSGSGYAYQWNENNTPIAGANSSTLLVTTSGSYTVTITDGNGCVNTTATPTVVTVVPPVVVSVNSETICNGSSAVLTASGATNYVWSNGATGSTITVNPTSNTSYTVTGSTNGCSGSAVSNVTVNPIPPIEAITGATEVCVNSTTLLANATTGGTWSTSNGAVASVSSAGLVTGLTTGSTTITYTINVNGCSNAVSAVVNVNSGATATITAGGATTFCAGGSVVLTASAGASYLWSNGAQTQSITVTASGSYYVTVNSASGCSATSTATLVTVTPNPVVDIYGATDLCVGQTELYSSNITGGTWSSTLGQTVVDQSNTQYMNQAGAPSQYQTFTAGQSGTLSSISLNHANPQGNTAVSTVTVNVYSGTGTSGTLLGSNSVTLPAQWGSTWNVYSFSGISITQGQVYTFEVTTPTVVYSWLNVNVNNPYAGGEYGPSISGWDMVFETNVTPAGGSITTGGQFTASTAGNATISYSVTQNGCTTTATYPVTINTGTTATITAGGATTFCAGGSVTLTANSGSSYLWSNGAQTQSITVTAGGSYYVTVTNASGCSATSTSTTVTVNPLPTVAAITGATNVCSGLTTQLASATTGGTWTSSNTAVATVSATGVVTGVTAGTATMTYSITDANGCTNSVTATVNVNAGTTATITAGGATTFCAGGSVTLTANSGSSYLWSNGAQTQSITVTAGGSYYVTVTNASGCSATSTATEVTVNALPIANILANGPLTFCQGGSVTLSASPVVAGNTYLWSNGATTASINVTSSATITVTVTSAAGCSTTSLPTSVNVFTNPTATITASGATTFCQGGSVTLTANAGTGYSYQWSNNTNNQVMTATTAGSYTVTVTDANGCSVTSAPTVVTVNALPTTAAITGTNSVCIGGTTLLSTTATNPVWSSANTAVATVAANGLVTGVSAGTVVVSYTITNANGCTNTASVTVTVNQLPTAAIASVGATTFCQGGSVTLLASNAPAGMTYTYQWRLNGTAITGATSNTYVANASGNYSVTITTNSGCAATSAATTVTVNPLPVLAANTGSASVCENGTVTLANAQAGGLWSTANNTIATINAVTGLVTGVNPGTTTLTYTFTNANGCTNSVSTNFTVNALPAAVITANGTTTFCQGGSVVLTANTGSSYLWSNGQTTQSITVSNTSDITVTVTNANGCSATSAITSVVVNALPVANITSLNGNSFCQGGSVTLVASTGSSYAWSNGAFTQSVTVSSTQTLTVTVTNSDGCSATSAPFTVTMNAAPVATITANGPTTFCAGGSVTLSAPAAASYLWSSGETTQTIVASVDGPYTVTITNGNACSATSANMNITVNNLPTVQSIAGNNTVCAGSTTTLTNATIGGTWTSSNAAIATVSSTGVVTGVAAGTVTMTYTVTNASGCSNAVSFNITVNATPVLTAIAGTAVVCEGATTLLANAQANGTWSSSDVAIATVAANGVVSGLNAGSATITYTYTNAEGCTSSVSQALVVNALPSAVVTASGATTFCAGGSVILTAPAGMTYAWSTGEPTQSITVSTSGAYAVTITNANGCAATSAPVAVTVNALPTVAIANIGATTFCQGGDVTLISPLNSTYSYAWSNGATAITGATSNTYVATASGSYALTVTDANGCTATSAAIPVTVNALPLVTATANGATTFCQGGSVTINAAGAATYVWSNGATTPSITLNASEVVTVTGTTVDGCSSVSNAISVVVNPLPTATITSTGSTACLGSSVTLTANGGATYSWSNGSTNQSITVTAGNTYTVTVTSAAGCTSTASETVTFNANPAVTIAANGPTVFCQGGSLTLTATGGSNYVWSNGDQGASTTVAQSGAYFVVVTNAAGCTTQSSVVNVTVNAAPVVAAITGANTVCEGGNMTLTSATPGGVWTSANNFIATIDGAGNVTGLNAGSTTITYTVSNNGCTATAVAQVNVLNNPVTPTITASGATSVCPGGSVVLFASNAANYQWSNGPTTPFIVATQSGAYTVTATGLNGCSATSLPVNVFIGDNTAPVITAPLNVTVTPNLGCEAIGVTLGSPVTSDNCSVASVSNDAPAIFPIGTTTVTWTVTDASGNTSTATQIVTVVDQTAPTALAPANVTVSSNNYCEATGVDLGLPFATDNCTNNLVITNNAPATYPLGTTTVTWTITDAAGNITTVDQTVTVVDQTAPVLLLANTSVILDAAGYATIGFEDLDNGSFDNCGIAGAVLSQSAFDCSNVGNNLVSVILTDNNGNQTTAQVMVTVVASDACGSSNWAGPNVPDAFTPNGNNYNDTWVIPGLEGYNTKEMAVYSRYGTLVHYSGQYNNDWDGTLLNTGTPVPDGTYYYILNLDGGKQLNGYVYINRVKQ